MATKTEYLEAMFKSIKRSHYKLRKESDELFESNQVNYRSTGEFIRRINDMALVERSEALRKVLTTVSQEAARQRTENVEYASQLKQNISEDMERFQKILDEHQANSRRRHKEYQEINKEQEKATQLKVKEGGVAARQAESMVMQHKEALVKTEQQLNDSLANFEFVRVQYVSDKLERILRSQIQYHMRSVEYLTTSLSQLKSVSAVKEGHALWRELEAFDSKTGINIQNHRPPNFNNNPINGSGLRIANPDNNKYVTTQKPDQPVAGNTDGVPPAYPQRTPSTGYYQQPQQSPNNQSSYNNYNNGQTPGAATNNNNNQSFNSSYNNQPNAGYGQAQQSNPYATGKQMDAVQGR